jgi:hypothetical protein
MALVSWLRGTIDRDKLESPPPSRSGVDDSQASAERGIGLGGAHDGQRRRQRQHTEVARAERRGLFRRRDQENGAQRRHLELRVAGVFGGGMGEIRKSNWMPDGTMESLVALSAPGDTVSTPPALKQSRFTDAGIPRLLSPCARKLALRPRNRAQAGRISGIPTSGSEWAVGRPVRPLVLVSDSNGSRSVTTPATLGR